MKQNRQSDQPKGWVLVKLEPVLATTNRIYIHVNDHYDVSDRGENSIAALRVLEQRWDESLKYSDFIVHEAIQQIGEK